jgi:ferredoxin
MTWSVTIDRDLCMGAGLCVMYAPDTFDHDAATKAILLPGERDALDLVRVAIESCPTHALTLQVDDERGER